MRFRYLIERGPVDKTIEENEAGVVSLVDADLYVTVITAGDDTGSSAGDAHRTVEAAKAHAEDLHRSDGATDDAPLRWRDPPVAWQPDAIAVSQWLDDDVPERRDP